MVRKEKSFLAWHVYCKANGATDWVASYAVNHSIDVVWIDLDVIRWFLGILFSQIFLKVFIGDKSRSRQSPI